MLGAFFLFESVEKNDSARDYVVFSGYSALLTSLASLVSENTIYETRRRGLDEHPEREKDMMLLQCSSHHRQDAKLRFVVHRARPRYKPILSRKSNGITALVPKITGYNRFSSRKSQGIKYNRFCLPPCPLHTQYLKQGKMNLRVLFRGIKYTHTLLTHTNPDIFHRYHRCRSKKLCSQPCL